MNVNSELYKIGNTVSYIIVIITATNLFKNYSYNSLNKNQHFILWEKCILWSNTKISSPILNLDINCVEYGKYWKKEILEQFSLVFSSFLRFIEFRVD
jgi:hypothetical protein